MNYEIIFYLSGKTAEIQSRLETALAPMSLTLEQAQAAVTPKELANMLSDATKKNRLVFIVGGQNQGKQSAAAVLKKVLGSKKGVIVSEKVESKGRFCEMKSVGEQSIVLLPDEPETADLLMPELKTKLSEKFKLKLPEEDTVSVEDITKELDRKMSGIHRVKIDQTGITAEKRLQSQLTKLRITIAVLLVLAALQLGAASYLFLSEI